MLIPSANPSRPNRPLFSGITIVAGEEDPMKGYDIGKRLKEIRKQRNLSLSEVSAKTDVGVSYLSMLENNKRRVNLEILEKLAGCYKVRLQEFFQQTQRRPAKSLETHLKGLSKQQDVFTDNPEAQTLLKKLA
jgi:transcriptional regulator with XRE-family HTH domain